MSAQPIWFREVTPFLHATAATALPLIMRVDSLERRTLVDPQFPDRPFWHRDFFALYIVQRGRGIHIINGVPYGVSRGDVYVMDVGDTHRYADHEGLALDALYFKPSIFTRPMREALEEVGGLSPLFVTRGEQAALDRSGWSGRLLHLSPQAQDHVGEMLEELRAECQSGTRCGAILARGLFLRLLVHLARRQAARNLDTHGDAVVPLGQEQTVAAVVRILDAHYMEPIRIEQIAASLFVSPDRLSKQFAAAMGRTARDYLSFLRIERAKALLAASGCSVAEVGVQAGFLDAAYFARAFRQATGTTPRQYRNSRGRPSVTGQP